MIKKYGITKLFVAVFLVLIGLAIHEAVTPPVAKAQLSEAQEEQLRTYEVTYVGNDGVWAKEQFQRSFYAVDGGALVVSNPFTGRLFKAYSADVWITIREVSP